MLDSIFTDRSARYALEGALFGFATESALGTLPNPNIIMFSECNCEAFDAPDNAQHGSVEQGDYDTSVGEAALVQWDVGKYADRGWIRYNRHGQRANYIYFDGHVESLRWTKPASTSSPITASVIHWLTLRSDPRCATPGRRVTPAPGTIQTAYEPCLSARPRRANCSSPR
jgi:prepilin-type processing-associated H-X9-DG protein